jgi:hypothetical protein
MRAAIKIITLSLIGVTFFVSQALSAPKAQGFKIKLSAEKAKKDRQGTDTAETHAFSVGFAEKDRTDTVGYTVIYFLDGQPLSQWTQQTIPFSFKRNFKGLEPGEHTIKIDVEDANNTVVATDSIRINVK